MDEQQQLEVARLRAQLEAEEEKRRRREAAIAVRQRWSLWVFLCSSSLPAVARQLMTTAIERIEDKRRNSSISSDASPALASSDISGLPASEGNSLSPADGEDGGPR
jgi:hypothetical protein